MHVLALRKGGGFSNESPTSLSQGAIESLHMVGIGFRLILSELLDLDDFSIRLPDIGKAVSGFVGIRNRLPEFLAGWFPATANHKSHDLTRPAT